jgi:hypothetical protein
MGPQAKRWSHTVDHLRFKIKEFGSQQGRSGSLSGKGLLFETLQVPTI